MEISIFHDAEHIITAIQVGNSFIHDSAVSQSEDGEMTIQHCTYRVSYDSDTDTWDEHFCECCDDEMPDDILLNSAIIVRAILHAQNKHQEIVPSLN